MITITARRPDVLPGFPAGTILFQQVGGDYTVSQDGTGPGLAESFVLQHPELFSARLGRLVNTAEGLVSVIKSEATNGALPAQRRLERIEDFITDFVSFTGVNIP